MDSMGRSRDERDMICYGRSWLSWICPPGPWSFSVSFSSRDGRGAKPTPVSCPSIFSSACSAPLAWAESVPWRVPFRGDRDQCAPRRHHPIRNSPCSHYSEAPAASHSCRRAALDATTCQPRMPGVVGPVGHPCLLSGRGAPSDLQQAQLRDGLHETGRCLIQLGKYDAQCRGGAPHTCGSTSNTPQ